MKIILRLIFFLTTACLLSECYSDESSDAARKKAVKDLELGIRSLDSRFNIELNRLRGFYAQNAAKLRSEASDTIKSLTETEKNASNADGTVSEQAEKRLQQVVIIDPVARLEAQVKRLNEVERKLLGAMRRIRELEKTEEMFNAMIRNRPDVPDNAVSWRGHHYMIISERLPFYSSCLKCAIVGGHLLRIDSVEEHAFIRSLTQGATVPAFWVDGSDAVEEGEWRYSNGEVMAYNAWARGEPNAGRSSNFCTLWGGGGWALGDNGGGEENFSICEWDF